MIIASLLVIVKADRCKALLAKNIERLPLIILYLQMISLPDLAMYLHEA